MSDSVNSSSASNQFDGQLSALGEANVQLGLRMRTKVQEMGEFNKKTVRT